jgi:hypothetical protein
VLRFLCELESLLFDYSDGTGIWGVGCVSLGNMLSPTPNQVELLKQTAKSIQSLRQELQKQSEGTTTGALLTRSARARVALGNRLSTDEEQANEKLRIAKNADYFSCHLNFSKRLADIAEKLRFMDIQERPPFLEEELNLLNSSGTMGGDPLNRLSSSFGVNGEQHLIRVVRIPSKEGHVFRSKERTPVLLLMEVIDESAEPVVLDPEPIATTTTYLNQTQLSSLLSSSCDEDD